MYSTIYANTQVQILVGNYFGDVSCEFNHSTIVTKRSTSLVLLNGIMGYQDTEGLTQGSIGQEAETQEEFIQHQHVSET